MAVWFTSDTHFGHANIIRLSNRPFTSVSDMDTAIKSNWQSRVRPEDDVWHLGDFAFKNGRAAASYLSELPGNKHLVWGNHDSEETKNLPGWASSQAMAEIKLGKTVIVLCHYAMRVWHWSGGGTLQLYGHSHGTLPGNDQSCDVGVDCWGFCPVTLDDIRTRLVTLPTYHGYR